MAIQLTPENRFERVLDPSRHDPSDAKVHVYYLESLDPDKNSEKWANMMLRNLEIIARSDRNEPKLWRAYFYLEDGFHRKTNEAFSAGLGVEPLPSLDLPEEIKAPFNGCELTLYRRGLVYGSGCTYPDAIEYQNYPFTEQSNNDFRAV